MNIKNPCINLNDSLSIKIFHTYTTPTHSGSAKYGMLSGTIIYTITTSYITYYF